MYTVGDNESSSSCGDSEDDHVISHNVFEVDCFDVQPQPSSTESPSNATYINSAFAT